MIPSAETRPVWKYECHSPQWSPVLLPPDLRGPLSLPGDELGVERVGVEGGEHAGVGGGQAQAAG